MNYLVTAGVDSTLLGILGLHRAHGSEGERELIENYIVPTGAKPDNYGNYILRIGKAPILWSSHTDTVHSNYLEKKQKLLIVENTKEVISDNSNCLGADNGAGVWMCLELIKAGVEGLYIFHREEESGGKGSRFIVSQTPEILKDIQYAVAFDRRGTDSVITHQVTRTCSNIFAKELCDALDMGHKPDDGGTFTDTANYAHIIPECTNISAGFHREHTPKEWLDTVYLANLRDKMISLDLTELSVSRDVTDAEYAGSTYYYGGNYQRNQHEGADLIWQYPLQTMNLLRAMGVADEVVEYLREYEALQNGY